MHDHAVGHPKRWWILAVLCLSLVLVVLDNTVTNVALPTISRELGATGTQLQWIVDAYVLVFGGLLLTMGALGDRFGRRGALQLGLLIVAAASLAALWVERPWELVAVRSAMGVGAALVMPSTLSIVTDVFPDDERGRAISIWAGLAGAGGVLGLLLGGWLLENFSWQSVFTVNVPIAGAGLVLSALLVPTSRDTEGGRIDVMGTILSVVALASLLYGVIEGPSKGWSSAQVMWALALAALAWPAFILRQATCRAPMLPLSLFSERGFAVGCATVSLVFLVMFSTFFVFSQYLQFVMGFTPLEAGIRFLPLVAGILLSAPASDHLCRRFGTSRVVGSGLLVATGALAAMSRLGADSSYTSIALGLVFLGVGMGLVMAPSTALVMTGVPRSKAGVASAMNDATREVGGAVGIAVLGSILNGVYAARVEAPAFLPQVLRDRIGDSISVALQVSARLGGANGAALASSARAAFVEGMSWTYAAAAAACLLASVGVFFLMPEGADAGARAAQAEKRSAEARARASRRIVGRGAGVTLVALVVGVAVASSALAYVAIGDGLSEDGASPLVFPSPPVVENSTFKGEVVQAARTQAGPVGTAPEGIHDVRTNLTSGHAMAILKWQPMPGSGAPTLHLSVEIQRGTQWDVISEGVGGPGLQVITPVANLTTPLRVVVSAASGGPVDQPYILRVVVASPDVPLPPPAPGPA